MATPLQFNHNGLIQHLVNNGNQHQNKYNNA